MALACRARPDAVINAAYRQSDWATTADGAAHVALAAAAAGARLVHVSSDAVFSGTASGTTRGPGPVDVRLDSTWTQARLTTRLRGAREFLAPTPA
jgi:dTDP-4-dehydrorhamnose reductase